MRRFRYVTVNIRVDYEDGENWWAKLKAKLRREFPGSDFATDGEGDGPIVTVEYTEKQPDES